MLKIITEGDLRYLAGVILILTWLGKKYAGDSQKLWGGLIAIVAFLAYAAYAFEYFPPRRAEELWHIALRALVTFGLSLGFSWIVLALLTGITTPIWESLKVSAELARQNRIIKDREERERQERLRAEARLQELAKRPKPPPVPVLNSLEKGKLAREKYESTLRLIETAGLDETELNAARLRAKQKYMRDIDGLL